MTRMFDFDPVPFASAFVAQGYVHIPKGLTAEFYQALACQVEEYRRVNRLNEWAIGDKQQSLYEFPEGGDYRRQLCKAVGAVCGLDPQKIVISERHIKDYEATANPNPLAHKDRYATEIAVGFSVNVSKESTLVFFPHDDVGVNPFNSSAELRASFTEDRLPEKTLGTAKRVEFHDSPRDVFMFRGNAIWHFRSKPAGTTMVYFKLNSFHCDPLGEDPLTPELRQQTQAHVVTLERDLDTVIPVIGRRVDFIHRRYDRDWNEVAGVVLWSERHVTIDDQELRALKKMDGRRTLRAVVQEIRIGADVVQFLAKIRRLAVRGIVDLMPAKTSPGSSVPEPIAAAAALASSAGFLPASVS